MVYLLAGAVIVVVLLLASRANELFCVSVRDGRPLLVRGRIPPALLRDFGDVVSDPPVKRATIKASRSAAHAELAVSGVSDEGQEQRLRNVFNVYPLSNIKSAPSSKKRTLWQVLGIAWLAWLFDSATDA